MRSSRTTLFFYWKEFLEHHFQAQEPKAGDLGELSPTSPGESLEPCDIPQGFHAPALFPSMEQTYSSQWVQDPLWVEGHFGTDKKFFLV